MSSAKCFRNDFGSSGLPVSLQPILVSAQKIANLARTHSLVMAPVPGGGGHPSIVARIKRATVTLASTAPVPEDIAADLAGAGPPIAATRIGNRVALARAIALGLGVIENARMTPAAAEISALAEEIRGALSG
jgi:hypothetical protein